MADRAVPALIKETHSWKGGERAASGSAIPWDAEGG